MARTNNIALVFDFDLTLTKDYSQTPIFEFYNYVPRKFWGTTNKEYKRRIKKLEERPQVGIFGPRQTLCYETTYADVLVDFVQRGIFPGLTLDKLGELGSKIEFHPGVLEFFKESKELVKNNKRWKEYNIGLEFYVISCAIREMIAGSKIAEYLTGLFATEFIENEKGISLAIHKMSYTEKTKYLYQINKGPEFNENAYVPHHLRRITKKNINHIGDGQSDVPCSTTVRKMGGKRYGIIKPSNEEFFKEAPELKKEGRFDEIGPPDYRNGSKTRKFLDQIIVDDAERTADEIDLGKKVSKKLIRVQTAKK